MHPDFWHQRWRENRIGFHRDEVMPLLERHWPSLGLPPGGRVLVPLCGKSLDMAWLASRGHRVLGVELSPLAVRQFFEERRLRPHTRESALGRHHSAGGIEIIEGDAFVLDDALLSGCAGVYDRAALIALPPDMRRRYADSVYARLPPGCRALLITLEHPRHEKDGPPFPVDEDEVHGLYDRHWTIESAERRDILASEPSFQAAGVTSLHTAVYRMRRRD